MDSAVLDRIIDAAPIAILLVERSTGRIVNANLAFADLFEVSRQDLIDTSAVDLVIWPSVSEVFAARNRLLSENGTRNLELTLSSKTGLPRSVLLSIAPLQLGGVELALVMFVDNTEKLRLASQSHTLQGELAHVLRLGTLGEMASALAHELNQPLTSICLYASSALDLIQHSENDELIECLNRVSTLGRHAAAIVERIRDFVGSRLSYRTRHSINVLIEKSLQMLHSELTAAGIAVVCELGQQLPEIKADGVQIQQVLINLIRNAAEAMSKIDRAQRKLLLQTESLDDKICVRVSDTGHGIDAAIAEHLFESFRSTKENGLGLGLRICHTLIASHGGTLDFRANDSGGTTFSFVLPIADSS
jgi:two-component system, LuxR family, sensor kinase FixL